MSPVDVRVNDAVWGWQDEAACAGIGLDVWFAPEREQAADRAEREEYAKRICGVCPVRDACLAHALNYDERYGIWGGLTEEERYPSSRRSVPTRQQRILCDACRRERRYGGRGPNWERLCGGCRTRWVRAGKPPRVPPLRVRGAA